ncbi:hypothetical protein [Actinocorallia longicatena]|uniref:hypothetical protein n=1 Tax=Actinocorallia longicatena TaxID=111803 RepID=UPI0031E24DAA
MGAARRSWSRSLYQGRGAPLRLLAAIVAVPLSLLTLLWGWWRSRKNTTAPAAADSPSGQSSPADETPSDQPITDPSTSRGPGQPAQEPHRDRHRNTRPAPSRRSFTVTSGFPLAVAAADVNTAAATYDPPDMWRVAADLRQLPDVFASVALALRTYTGRLEGGFPIDPHVVEAIAQLYQGIAQVAVAAQEIEPLFRRVHADDLKRDEAPRTNEPAWNV